MSRTKIETYTGLYLDFLNPTPDQIVVEDIARGLSMTCRFGGQVSEFYSVAQHAYRVADDVHRTTHSSELAFAALHHDSHEAYVTDWPTPLKQALGTKLFDEATNALDEAIAEALGIDADHFEHPDIKAADIRALRAEAYRLKHSHGIGPHWGTDSAPRKLVTVAAGTPADGEQWFLAAHRRLAKESQCLPT